MRRLHIKVATMALLYRAAYSCLSVSLEITETKKLPRFSRVPIGFLRCTLYR